MKSATAILVLGLFPNGWAQIPDLDAFTEDLDITLPPASTPTPSAESNLPRVHLFERWEAAAGFPTFALPEETTSTFQLVIPEGTYVVAPNAARISEAYQQLAALQEADWAFSAPLKVVLHADGNVSVAIRMAEKGKLPLPPGLDLSPVPELRLVGNVADIQIADRVNPLVLGAFTGIQQDAEQAGWELDRREFFFLPLEPGKVWFGLKILDRTE
jgi:hypothetical protein